MRELERCPDCKSGDVGGASGIVHCYRCKVEVRAATTPEAAEQWNIRAIFMRHGFTSLQLEPGSPLHALVRDLLESARERCNAGERAMQKACGELPDGYQLEIGLEAGAGWVDVIGPDGDRLECEFDTGSGMTPRIIEATEFAIEHAKEAA